VAQHHSESGRAVPTAVRWLRQGESAVLVLAALVLLGLAVLLLCHGVAVIIGEAFGGQMDQLGVHALDKVLLVMMILEIVATVAISIESHVLSAEPFLLIGIIAAIRRMLLITAETAALDDAAKFQRVMAELALLAFTVVCLALAVWILRRSAERDARRGAEG
jgi:uncharacterized membrane protein (DUF373 family)